MNILSALLILKAQGKSLIKLGSVEKYNDYYFLKFLVYERKGTLLKNNKFRQFFCYFS